MVNVLSCRIYSKYVTCSMVSFSHWACFDHVCFSRLHYVWSVIIHFYLHPLTSWHLTLVKHVVWSTSHIAVFSRQWNCILHCMDCHLTEFGILMLDISHSIGWLSFPQQLTGDNICWWRWGPLTHVERSLMTGREYIDHQKMTLESHLNHYRSCACHFANLSKLPDLRTPRKNKRQY